MHLIADFCGSGLIGLTSYLDYASNTTYVVERPAHTAVVFLAAIGLTLLATSHSTKQRHRRTPSDEKLHNGPLLWQNGATQHVRGIESIFALLGARSVLTLSRTSLAILTTALVVRVQLTRFLLDHVECLGTSLQSMLPAAAVILELMLPIFQRKVGSDDKRYKDDRRGTGRPNQAHEQQRSLIATILILSVACTVAAHAFAEPRSTYICASSAPFHWITPLLQHITTLVDTIIVLCISKIISSNSGDNTQEIQPRVRMRGIAVSVLVWRPRGIYRATLIVHRLQLHLSLSQA